MSRSALNQMHANINRPRQFRFAFLVNFTISEQRYNRVQPINYFSWEDVNPLTALRALIDFTPSNAKRFYSSMGNPLAGKGLTYARWLFPVPIELENISNNPIARENKPWNSTVLLPFVILLSKCVYFKRNITGRYVDPAQRNWPTRACARKENYKYYNTIKEDLVFNLLVTKILQDALKTKFVATFSTNDSLTLLLIFQ